MSPRKELRYIHALIAMSKLLTQIKLNLHEVESNAKMLKDLIVEENQIDLFEEKNWG